MLQLTSLPFTLVKYRCMIDLQLSIQVCVAVFFIILTHFHTVVKHISVCLHQSSYLRLGGLIGLNTLLSHEDDHSFSFCSTTRKMSAQGIRCMFTLVEIWHAPFFLPWFMHINLAFIVGGRRELLAFISLKHQQGR